MDVSAQSLAKGLMMNIEKTWQALMLMKDDMSASETERENAVRLLKKFDKVKIWTDQTMIADEVLSLPDLSNNALNLIRSVLTMKCRDVAVVFYEKQNEFHAYATTLLSCAQQTKTLRM